MVIIAYLQNHVASLCPEAALLLLENGADLETHDTLRNNILHHAATSGASAPLIHALCKHLKMPLATLSARNAAGNTPLVVAWYHQTDRTAHALIDELQKKGAGAIAGPSISMSMSTRSAPADFRTHERKRRCTNRVGCTINK